MRSPISAICLALALVLPSSAGAQIFADFDTSMGGFTCELYHDAAPQAVANFIALAEGSRAWVDVTSGAVRTGQSYYDGVTFHRVIDGFMNQSGSRNGLGTDGPGYRFRDEFSATLTHSGPGILSMANSGVNTNGGQFFVTVASANHLDGKHTVFGKVTAGMAVVDAINAVPKVVGEPSKPVTPIILNTVTIRRVGAAAEAFDIHAQDLPLCGQAKGRLRVESGVKAEFVLDAPQPAGSVIQAFQSPDLQGWVKLSETFQGTGSDGPPTLPLGAAELPSAFFHVPLVVYPDAMAPAKPVGKTLFIEWTIGGEDESLLITIDAAGTGGTVDYSEGEEVLAITYVGYRPLSLWQSEWIIETGGELAPLGIITNYKAKSAAEVSGNCDIYTWDASWNYFASGTFTLNH